MVTAPPRRRRPASADIFAKCPSRTLDDYRAAEELGLNPFYRELSSEIGPTIRYAGSEVIMLGSNNYLGLTTDPRVKKAAMDAVARYGTGVTGSRLLNGTLPLHTELEELLADWVGMEKALVFTTGYTANLGLISTLVQEGDAVFCDSAAHASLVDGARLADGPLPRFLPQPAEQLEAGPALVALPTRRRRGAGGRGRDLLDGGRLGASGRGQGPMRRVRGPPARGRSACPGSGRPRMAPARPPPPG